MIRLMKIFEIDPELHVIDVEGELINEVEPEVHEFFKKHIYQSINNKKAKDVRFRSERSRTFIDCVNCFNETMFSESSKNIAENLATNIHSNVTSNFHLIITLLEMNEGDNVDLEVEVDEEYILSIIKMETNHGIQMEQNEFIIQPNMLPDLGNQLQKGSFVIKSFVENYEENNQGTKFHSRILDKQDRAISNYFMNLMGSTVVADDGESSKLAQQFISKNVKKYVASEGERVAVDRTLGSIFSRRERTSVGAIVTQLEQYVNDDTLERAGYTIDGLSNEIFNQMRQRNPSVRNEFESIPYMPEKTIIRNEDRSVMVSIEKGLIEDELVEIQMPTADNRKYTIIIPEDIIN